MGNCLETFFYVTLSKQHRDTQKAVYARFLPRQSWRFHLKRNPHKHSSTYIAGAVTTLPVFYFGYE